MTREEFKWWIHGSVIRIGIQIARLCWHRIMLCWAIVKVYRNFKEDLRFKAYNCYFLKNYFLPNDSPSKTMKDVFFSSKKLFLLSRYSNFTISFFPSFSLCKPCFRAWSKIHLKVYAVISCLNKNLVTHFVWYLQNEKN